MMTTLPINDRLEWLYNEKNEDSKQLPSAQYRPYQNRICDIAIRQNTIVFLGTGLGKTFISVMLLNSPEYRCKIFQEGKRVAFLTPTQELARQQAEYLQQQTQYLCKVYCGGSSRNHWDSHGWEQEFKKVHIAIMTAQIFCHCISTNIISWEKFVTVIFDEGHHIAPNSSGKESGHAYCQIMRHYDTYYNKNRCDNPRPRLLVLTASLLNRIHSLKKESITDQVIYLEKMYKAECVTDLHVQKTSPRFLVFSYDCDSYDSHLSNDILATLLSKIKCYLIEALKIKKAQAAEDKVGKLTVDERNWLRFQRKLKKLASDYCIKPHQFPDIISGLIKGQESLGIWALCALVKKFIGATSKMTDLPSSKNSLDIGKCYSDFLQLLHVIKEALEATLNRSKALTLDLETQLLGTATPKMLALLDVLEREHRRSLASKAIFSCIIFIRSRLEVIGLTNWMNHVARVCKRYEFVKADFAIGIAATNTSKYSCVIKRTPDEQMMTLKNFRDSTLNVIFTTAVLEEGIDLPVCSTVIRYDCADTMREYIQSRGRARMTNSTYISMCASGAKTAGTLDGLKTFNEIEITLLDFFSKRRQYSIVSDDGLIPKHEIDEFFCPNDKVRITSTMATVLLEMYLTQKANIAKGSSKALVERSKTNETPARIQSTLYMPKFCPIRSGIQGQPKINLKDADHSAALAALKELHRLNEIGDDCLLHKATSMSQADRTLLESHLEGKSKAVTENDVCVSEWDRRNLLPWDPEEYRVDKDRQISYDIEYHCHNMFFPYRGKFTHYDDIVRKMPDQLTPILTSLIDGIKNLESKLTAEHKRKVCVVFLSPHELGEVNDDRLLYREDNMDFELYRLNILPEDHLTGGLEGIAEDDLRKKSSTQKKRSSYHHFTPLIGDMPMILEDNAADRTYNLFGIRFNALQVVNQYAKHFEPLVYGIITDIDIGDIRQVMPCSISNHYGKFNVEIVELNDKFTIKPRDYSEKYYLNYMRNFLTKSLNIEDLDIDRLREHCPMYIVPLKKGRTKQIDTNIIRDSYNSSHDNSSRTIRPGQIVVGSAMMPSMTRESFYIVDEIITDLNPNSQHVDMTDECITFAQYACKQYNLSLEKNWENQPIIKVRQLSKDYATIGEGKQIDERYTSTPIHFIQECLAYFDSYPEYHLQTYMLNPIIYRIFQIKSIQNFLGLLAVDTAEFTDHNNNKISAPPISSEKRLNSRQIEPFGEDTSGIDGNERKFVSLEPDDSEAKSARQPVNLEYEHHCTNKILPFLGRFAKQHLSDKEELLAKIKSPLMRLIHLYNYLVECIGCVNPVKIDRSISPSLMFDSFKPELQQSRIEPILRAFTLKRANDSMDLECLENVGDSYLKYRTSIVLFNRIEGGEGLLTSMRSRLVSNYTLCKLAITKKLGKFAFIRSCDISYTSYLFGSSAIHNEKMKDYDNELKDKDLADIVEALVGAQLIHFGEVETIRILHWLGIKLFDVKEMSAIVRDQKVKRETSRSSSLLADINDDSAGSQYNQFYSTVMKFEDVIGYKFKDKANLIQAFAHPSYISNTITRSYQRLEFIGDAILDYLVTRHIYHHGIDMKPGQITDIRMALVNNHTFARIALKYKFDLYILHDQKSIFDELIKIRRLSLNSAHDNNYSYMDREKGIKLLADVFESLAGAIYVDSGNSLDTVWSIYYPMMKQLMDNELRAPTINPVRRLFEKFPGRNVVKFIKLAGKKQNGITIICRVFNLGKFVGVGYSEKDAKMRAALNALNYTPSDMPNDYLPSKDLKRL